MSARRLASLSSALVGVAEVLCHVLACLSDVAVKYIGRLVELKAVHEALVIQDRLLRVGEHLLVYHSADRHYSVKVLLNGIDAGTDNAVEYVGEQESVLYYGIRIFRLCVGIVGLRHEAYAALTKT